MSDELDTSQPDTPADAQPVNVIEQYGPALAAGMAALAKRLEQYQQYLLPVVEKLATIDWASIQERYEQLPGRSRTAMERAAGLGWHFNWLNSLQDTLHLVDALSDADAPGIHAILTAHYEENLTWYTSELCRAYPDRGAVIEAAVYAHQHLGELGYALSVPVFLAQADGIFSVITGTGTESAFNKVKGKSTTKGSEWLESRIADEPRAVDLLPSLLGLGELHVLKSAKQRLPMPTDDVPELNRHQVLHGEVSDYGTQLNSLKAFSLLVAVALHLPSTMDHYGLQLENSGPTPRT